MQWNVLGEFEFVRSQRGVRPMKIAQIAPLYERVPPKLYGGTERVVFYLTEELVRQGHDVTLFASGDFETSAKLVRCCDMALRLDPSVKEPLLYHVMMLEEVRREIDQFDVLHFHIDFLHAPLVRNFARSYRDDASRPIGSARISSRSIGFFRSSPSSRFQAINASICLMRIGSALFIMVFPATSFLSSRAPSAVIWRFLGGFRRKKGRTAQSRSPREPECR